MKIILLDVDGVVNTIHHLKKQKRETGEVTNKNWDSIACKHIVLLCEHYRAKIVLISSWRHEYSMSEIEEIFESNEIPSDYLLDRTTSTAPQVDGQNYCRGHEIKHWLEQTEYKVDSYVIIDDEAEMLKEQVEHLVRTDKEKGFATKEAVTKASEILERGYGG